MNTKLKVIAIWLVLIAPAAAYWSAYDSDGWAGFAVGMYAFLVTMPVVERVFR